MVTAEHVHDVLGIGFGPASLAVAIAFAESPSPVDAAFVEIHRHYEWHPGMMINGSKMQISFLKDLATMRNPASTYSFVSYLHAHGRLASFVNLSTFTPSRAEFSDYMAWCALRVAEKCSIAYGERVDRVEAVRSEPNGAFDLVRVHCTRLDDGSTSSRLARNIIVSTGGKPNLPPFLRSLAAPGTKTADVILHTSEYLQRIEGVLDGILAPVALPIRKLHFSLPPSPPESDNGSRTSPAESPRAIEPIEPTFLSAPGLRIAVIGAGQSAAECFADVRRRLAERLLAHPLAIGTRPQIDLLIRHGALRPSDDSAFSNEVFDPSGTDLMHAVGTAAPSTLSGRVGLGGAAELRHGDAHATVYGEARKRVMAEAKATNYSVVNPRNVESLYDTMYEQRVEADREASSRGHGSSSLDRDPLLTILPWREIDSAAPSGVGNGVRLQVRHMLHDETEAVDYDAVIVGTGYQRQQWRDILFSSDHSSLLDVFGRGMDEDRSADLAHTSAPAPSKPDEPFTVQRDYRLTLPEHTQAGVDFKPRIWLQGCTEATHGISDSLLSVLAVRAGEVADSFSAHANRA